MRRAYLPAFLGLVAAATVVVAPGGPPTAAAQDGPDGWGERAPMIVPRSEMSIAELGDRVYALGGYPGARITSTDV